MITQAPSWLSQAPWEHAYSDSYCVLSASQWVQAIPTEQESQHEVPLGPTRSLCAGWVGSAWLLSYRLTCSAPSLPHLLRLSSMSVCVFVLSTGLGYCRYRAQTEEGTDRSQSLGASTGGFSKLSLQWILPNNQGGTLRLVATVSHPLSPCLYVSVFCSMGWWSRTKGSC